MVLKGLKHEIFVAGFFLHKSDLYGSVTLELGQKIQKLYGWNLIFTYLSASYISYVSGYSKKMLSFVGKQGVSGCFYIYLNRPEKIFKILFTLLKNFSACKPTVLKISQRIIFQAS
jgi:hypothetical protein